MIVDVNVALTWILFLALFPMAFFWLRSAWRIVVCKDYSDVALKRGIPPDHPAKFAPYAFVISFMAGIATVIVILSVMIGQADYKTWTAMAGIIIWCKMIANFILSRHAHPIAIKRKA